MAQASSPLYPQGGNAGNPHAVHPNSIQLHAQLQNHHNEPVVIVQPPVYQTCAPLADPVPDYMCYSKFTTMCCCICLGGAAVYYSKATRKANGAGRRAEAERNSQTALILNHVAVVVGSIVLILYIFHKIYSEESYP